VFLPYVQRGLISENYRVVDRAWKSLLELVEKRI
jgi:hypothetical protein